MKDMYSIHPDHLDISLTEPYHGKAKKITCMHGKNLDQPGQWPSVISLHCLHKDGFGVNTCN